MITFSLTISPTNVKQSKQARLQICRVTTCLPSAVQTTCLIKERDIRLYLDILFISEINHLRVFACVLCVDRRVRDHSAADE